MEPIELTLQRLQEMTDDFSERRKLGQGAYGKVYRGEDRNGQEVAVKLLHNVDPRLHEEDFKNEFFNLKKLNHPHIVKLIGYCYETKHRPMEYNGRIMLVEDTCRALCLEYLHNGSLHNFLSEGICDGRLDWHTRFKIIRGACEGLQYLHEEFKEPIYHLDLKPDNILLDINMVPKLADFGLSKIFGGEQTRTTQSRTGTPIISGLKGWSLSADMSAQEFINKVHVSWRENLKKKCCGSSLEAYCQQVTGCTEIALNCVEVDRRNRPKIADIVRKLTNLETVAEEITIQREACRQPSVKLVRFAMAESVADGRSGVPVFVMMPLDTVTKLGSALKRREQVQASLALLKSAGVEGIRVDVWWGIAEAEGPGKYKFAGYMELMEMARKGGLKVQAVMSFHQNLGGSVTIPLPRWVVEEMEKDIDLCYTDQWGRRNFEYVSLGCDAMPVLKGRTPVECYTDFMRAFRDHFADYVGKTIVEIQVGMGPAGELRYPSHPESNDIWRFPGIGAFQCNDRYMLSSLKAAAEAAGKPEWGFGAPPNGGGYHSQPEDTIFFKRDSGGWTTEYGDFFLSWYSQMLLDHGDRVLSGATSVYCATPGVVISVKLAGIHWQYGTRSHAPELTAGYYNTRCRDGYLPIARMLARHGAVLNFTCVEMCDHEQPQDAFSKPEALIRQVAAAACAAGVGLAGENALPRYDEVAYDQVVATATAADWDAEDGMVVDTAADWDARDRMVSFTYLRMGPDLFHTDNWHRFAAFVHRMSGAGSSGETAERVAHSMRIPQVRWSTRRPSRFGGDHRHRDLWFV